MRRSVLAGGERRGGKHFHTFGRRHYDKVMRPLLVLDTCGQTGYVALLDVDGPELPVAERSIAPRETQEQILPAIQSSLAAAALVPAQLAAIAVVTGPGSFTGVRVGLAVAKGLALAASLPLLPCSALAALACTALLLDPEDLDLSPGGPVTAWLDAGRTDIYAGTYTRQPALPPVCLGEQMLTRSAAMHSAQGPILIVEPSLADVQEGTLLVSPAQLQRATCALAVSLFHAAEFVDPVLVDANYLRVPDAELALRARQAGA